MVKGELEWFACACFAYVSGCGLTTGAFTLGTGCSAHGYTGMRPIPFAYFTDVGQKANCSFAHFGRSQTVKVQTKTSHCEWSHFHIARVCFPTGMMLHNCCV